MTDQPPAAPASSTAATAPSTAAPGATTETAPPAEQPSDTASPAMAVPKRSMRPLPGFIERSTSTAERFMPLVGRWGPAAVLTLAAATRLIQLGMPETLVFDETYYVKDGYAIWQQGYEGVWAEGANDKFEAGDPSALGTDPSFVVHPPLGKWIIGLGTAIFGMQFPWAWRLTVALIGIAIVALTMLITHGLTRSRTIATFAGFLVAIDGLAITMSRTALLDNVLAFFALAGVAAILMDRRDSPARTVRWWHGTGKPPTFAQKLGPVFWNRPWLVTAGVMFGCATSVKWSGAYLLAAFGLYTVFMDALDRKRVGIPGWHLGTLVTAGLPSFLLMIPAALATYLASYAGWFRGGYESNWLAANPEERFTGLLAWVPDGLQNLWHYHQSMYNFHVGLNSDHSYESPAVQWLVMLRPTAFWLSSGEGTFAFITSLSNPLIWYTGVFALGWMLFHFGATLDRKVGPILIAILASFLPWLAFPERTIFHFYTIVFFPFMVIGIALAVHHVLRPGKRRRQHRKIWLFSIGIFTLITALLSLWFAPIWYGIEIPDWYGRLVFWLPGWR